MPTIASAPRRRARRTQRERRETSYRRMLEAAVKLIERQGSSRTTLAQIGELSGYSYGLVSHRFGSKQALVRAVTREAQAAFARHEMGDLDRLSGLKALLVLVKRYLRAVAARNRHAFYVLIGEALGPVPEIRRDLAAADANFRDAIRAMIEEGIATGEIRRDTDPAAQAAIVVGALRGLAIQRLLDSSAFDFEAACRELESGIVRNLASRSCRGEKRADA